MMYFKKGESISKVSILLVWLTIALFSNSCTKDGASQFKMKPNAFGEIASLVVVADKEIWDGPIGDTIRYYYSSAYLILPQPEPILDLKYFSPTDFRNVPLKRELKSYLILADINDESSPTASLMKKELGPKNLDLFLTNPQKNNVVVGYDRWAKGQLIMFQMADSYESLVNNLKANMPTLVKKVRSQDAVPLGANAYQSGRNTTLEADIEAKMNVRLKIPNDFLPAINDGKAFWLRKETDKASFNLLISTFNYTDTKQFSVENLKAMRDTLGKKYVSTRTPNSYMIVNDVDLPIYGQSLNFNGKYAFEGRGIWEIENDYMAGAFICYLIHNPKTNQIVLIDGFLYAPGETKRNKMLQLEHIIQTARIP